MKQIQLRITTFDANGEEVDRDILHLESGAMVVSNGYGLRVYEAGEVAEDKPYVFEGAYVVCQVVVK